MTKCFRKKILLHTDFPGLFYGIKKPQRYEKFIFRYIAHHFYKNNDAIGFFTNNTYALIFFLQKMGRKVSKLPILTSILCNVHNFKHHEQKSALVWPTSDSKKPAYLHHYRMRKHYYLVNNKIIIGLTRWLHIQNMALTVHNGFKLSLKEYILL